MRKTSGWPTLRLRGRLLSSGVVIALALVLVGVLAHRSLQAQSDRSAAFIDREFQVLVALGDVRARLANARRYEKDLFLNMAEESDLARYRKQWSEQVAGMMSDLSRIEKLNAGEAVRVDRLRRSMAAYRDGVEQIVSRIETGALNDPWAANKAMEQHKDSVRAADRELAELARTLNAEALGSKAAMADAAREAMRWVALALATVIAVVLPLLYWNARVIVRPLLAARRFTRAVAAGDLGHEPPHAGRDEIGELMEALADMRQSLRRIVHDVRNGSDAVMRASDEIANGNDDLSERTAVQAESVRRTVQSTAQMTASIARSSESAQAAVALARSAESASTEAGRAMAKLLEVMDRTSNASSRIGEITSLIDSVAFQTNILSLNAAVEAARAGDHGRGFAVVATEVRSLAQRSAAAARDIRALIEQSTCSVADGARLARGAGDKVEQAIGEVHRMAALIDAIHAAGQEQAQGTAQVEAAMHELDAVARGNAALVQQVVSASHGMREHTRALAQTVAVFRLEQTHGGDAPQRSLRYPMGSGIATDMRHVIER